MKKRTVSQPKRGRSARNRQAVGVKGRDRKKAKQDEGTPSPWLRIFTAGSEHRPR
jgi:hypothetical protein